MARQYIVGDNKEPMTGEQLVKLASELFKREQHSCGQCAIPKYVGKAVWFLKNILHKKVQTKLDSEIEWKVM